MPTRPARPCSQCPLRPLPAFLPVSADELGFIDAQKVAENVIEAGRPVLTEGEPTDRVFTLLRGWAFRFKTMPDGRRQILNLLLPGDLIGLQADLIDATPHGVEALTDVVLCMFGRDAVWGFFSAYPKLALNMAWLAAHEERLVDDVLLSVGRRSALERMAALLVHIYKRAAGAGLEQPLPAEAAKGFPTVPFPLTQAHISDLLGLSVVHTNRTLQRLRRAGLIHLAEGRLGIGDLRALRRVGQYFEQPSPRRPLL